MKKISINRIAELAGVSKTTVSFVLNGKGDEKNISQETQKKIIDIAKAHHYQASFIARSLSLGKSYTFGLIVPDISNPFYGKIARHVEFYAEEKGYSVMVANTGENFNKELQLIESLKARQIDGIILASSADNYQQLVELEDKGLTIVFFDRVFKEQTDLCVDINNYGATAELTQLLIDNGHGNIGLISLTSYLPNIEHRISGFKSTLKNNDIELSPGSIIEINHLHKKDEIKRALDRLMKGTNPVTAIVFVNNVLAAEAVWAINTYYPHLADKLQFACFDNLDLFDYSKPKVISVLQPTENIACNCVQMLYKQIEENIKSQTLQLKTTIIKR